MSDEFNDKRDELIRAATESIGWTERRRMSATEQRIYLDGRLRANAKAGQDPAEEKRLNEALLAAHKLEDFWQEEADIRIQLKSQLEKVLGK